MTGRRLSRTGPPMGWGQGSAEVPAGGSAWRVLVVARTAKLEVAFSRSRRGGMGVGAFKCENDTQCKPAAGDRATLVGIANAKPFHSCHSDAERSGGRKNLLLRYKSRVEMLSMSAASRPHSSQNRA